MTNLQPDLEDVLQEEADPGAVTVPVCLVEQRSPVRTQSLPRKAGATQTRTLSTTPQRYLRMDPRRARVTVMGTDATAAGVFRYAFTQAAAQDPSSMAVWPGGQPLIIEAVTDLYLCAAAGSVTVGIATELWAEGE